MIHYPPSATSGLIVAVQLALFLRAAVPDDQVLDRGAEGGAVPERGPGGAPADGPGAAAAGSFPGDDQAACRGHAKRFLKRRVHCRKLRRAARRSMRQRPCEILTKARARLARSPADRSARQGAP